MKKTLSLGVLALALFSARPALAETAPVKMWRLDCGSLVVSNFGVFSDAGAFEGEKRVMTDSCYLIKHGSDYMIWDTGLDGALKGKTVTQWVFTISLQETIIDQLARIGVKPDQIGIVGLSHLHDDHTGQARDFPKAKLLLGKGDLDAFRAAPATGGPLDPARVKPWLTGGSTAEGVSGDKDVFGDGSVMMLNMSGHTAGHHVLLVRLPKTGPVLLSGDLFHSQANFDLEEVPSFNADRADTLASFDRFKKLAVALKAKVIIQHEPGDVAKLPAFPAAAE